MLPAAWGLDIGKSALKAVKLQKVKDEVEIVSITHIEYGSSDDHHAEVRAALRTFLDEHTLKGDQIVVALPGRTAFSRFIKLPPLEAKKLDEIVRYEAQQQIPFPIDEVVWDYQQLNGDSTSPGDEIEVGIFAIKKDLIHDFLSDLDEVRVKADLVTIAPLAIFNFIRYDTSDTNQNMIVVDVGADHTDLLVVEGNRFWIRNLPLAGDDMTRALMDKFQVPFEEAERLKRTAAKSPQAKKIFATMEPVLKDFVGEIHRSIGYYKAQAKDSLFEELILLGDASKLVGLRNFLAQELQLKVSRITRLNKLNLDEDVDVSILRKHVGAFGTAIGLALQGIGVAANNVNLVPREVQEERVVAAKKPVYLVAVLLVGVFLFFAWFARGSTEKGLQSALQLFEEGEITPKKLGALQREIDALSDVTAEAARLKELELVTGDRTRPVKILEAIRKAFPEENHLVPQAKPEEAQAFMIEADKKKLWILGLEFKREVTPERGEEFLLMFHGAVVAEGTMAESLAKAKQMFSDTVIQYLTIEVDGRTIEPIIEQDPDWQDFQEDVMTPLEPHKQGVVFDDPNQLHYGNYFQFRRIVRLPDPMVSGAAGEDAEETEGDTDEGEE